MLFIFTDRFEKGISIGNEITYTLEDTKADRSRGCAPVMPPVSRKRENHTYPLRIWGKLAKIFARRNAAQHVFRCASAA